MTAVRALVKVAKWLEVSSSRATLDETPLCRTSVLLPAAIGRVGYPLVSLPQLEGEPPPEALGIFAGVPKHLTQEAQRCEYRNGDVLLSSGADPDRLIVLIRGSVDITQGGTHIVSRAPIRLIGELAVIDRHPRSASVVARGAVVTYELQAAVVGQLLADAAFMRNLANELSWKLREATNERAWRYGAEELLFGEFRAHAAPELLQQLLKSGDLGTPRHTEVVVMFADVRNFTRKVLTMTPRDLTRDLGAFLDLAVEIVHRHGGMVDKFIGDAVMALWGYAPNPDDPTRALACARELVARAAGLRLDGDPIRVGAGLEMGLVTLGVIGSNGKRQFTALGPAVNLAARLQAETKELGNPICLGPDIARHLPEDIRAGLQAFPARDIRGVGQVNVWAAKEGELG